MGIYGLYRINLKVLLKNKGYKYELDEDRSRTVSRKKCGIKHTMYAWPLNICG